MIRTLTLFFITITFLTVGLAQQQFTPLDITVSPKSSSDELARIIARELKLDPDFILVQDVIRQSPKGKYIAFRQTYKGKPLQHAGAKVFIDKQGRIHWAMDFIKRDLELPTSDADWKLAEQALRFRLLKQFSTLDVQLAKLWYVKEVSSTPLGLPTRQLIPVWRAWTFSHNQDESYEVIVDAMSGVELERSDRAMYHNHRTDADTSGRARVWSPNPITASGSAYGTLFTDNNDMPNPGFEPYIDTVILQDINYDGSVFKLEGPYVTIVDLSANFVDPVTSINGDFFYTRDQDGWEDVMVYYHLDTYQRYIQSLGFTNLWGDKPLDADPHGRGDNDNSSFIPNGDNSSLGFGEGGVDDAEDADVIIHEYGHALAYAGSPNTNNGFERRGLDEGFGDYFAASFSYDKNAGGFGWGDVFSWDGHNPFWPGRSANNNAVYQTNPSSFYTHGELWASAMMEVRRTIGDTITDRLQFEILYGLSSNMTVPDAARLVIAADWMYNTGRHEGALRTIFCSRQIFTGTECLLTAVGDDIDDTNWIVQTPQAGSFNLSWPSQPQTWKATAYDLQGRMIATLDASHSRLGGLTAGVYVIKMQVDGKDAGARKVAVRE